MKEELKSCPFCKKIGIVKEIKDCFSKAPSTFFPTCPNEECLMFNAQEQDEQGGVFVDYESRQEAIDAWNTRLAEKEGLGDEGRKHIAEILGDVFAQDPSCNYYLEDSSRRFNYLREKLEAIVSRFSPAIVLPPKEERLEGHKENCDCEACCMDKGWNAALTAVAKLNRVVDVEKILNMEAILVNACQILDPFKSANPDIWTKFDDDTRIKLGECVQYIHDIRKELKGEE